MKLQYNVYYNLKYGLDNCDYETGGILGGTNNAISHFVFDKSVVNKNIYTYKPNTDYLNSKILLWDRMGIDFLGMFHSHIVGGTEPSFADLKYFERLILNTTGKTLYFIIIHPKKELSLYKGIITNSKLSIKKELIELF